MRWKQFSAQCKYKNALHGNKTRFSGLPDVDTVLTPVSDDIELFTSPQNFRGECINRPQSLCASLYCYTVSCDAI